LRNVPKLVLSDKNGTIFVHPHLKVAAMSGNTAIVPEEKNFIRLPKGSSLFYMPGYRALGFEEKTRAIVAADTLQIKTIYPVAAVLIPAFTRLLLPAAQRVDSRIVLPQWAYTAVGWLNGRFVVAATQIDSLIRQRPYFYKNRATMRRSINRTLKQFPRNRLFRHLTHCALHYNCRAAQNLFFGRWEAPLPISPSCNSRCFGCLSLQDAECSVASHSRIRFVPTPEEIAEVGISHLQKAREALVSFGQGCEGEPLLQFKTLRAAIRRIRAKTKRGTIHVNTNAYHPGHLQELAAAGLNSVRISINSFRKEYYDAYYRPKGYRFADVLRSIRVVKQAGLFVSLNVLVFPGITDTRFEIKRLQHFLRSGCIDIVQMRNLSIDPQLYLSNLPRQKQPGIGVDCMIEELRKAVPAVRFGYFNRAKERF